MPIDPLVLDLFTNRLAWPAPIHTYPPEQARRLRDEKVLPPPHPPPPLAGVGERMIPGPDGWVGARVYSPLGPGPHPGLVYFHGGGWVVGSLHSHDTVCRWLAHKAGRVVVSVDYRLAPEHPFPAAAEDSYAATGWAVEHAHEIGVDPGHVAVAGDSAGGNLAAVVSLMARDRGGPPLDLQVLIYPVIDDDFDRPSYLRNSAGPGLTRDTMRWFFEHYLGAGGDRSDPRCCPIKAEDLSRLPPALVITAEFDPLLDEGEDYARRLEAAGNQVTLTRYGGMPHAFWPMIPDIPQAWEAIDEVSGHLRRVAPRL